MTNQSPSKYLVVLLAIKLDKMSEENSTHKKLLKLGPIQFLLPHNNMFFNVHATLLDGDLEKVYKYIDERSLYNQQIWSEGYLLLCSAIMHEKFEVAKMLLKKRSNKRNEEYTRVPLLLATQKSCKELVNCLILKGANINSKDNSGHSALYYAIKLNNVKAVKLLIKFAAEIDDVLDHPSRYTPLCLAAAMGHVKIMRLLMKYGAQVEYSYTCSPELADLKKHCDVEDENNKRFPLLLRGRDIYYMMNISRMRPLHLATYWGHYEAVKCLLDNDADVNAGCRVICEKNYTALHFAVDRGSMKIVDLLLSRGARVDGKAKQKITPLHVAVMKGHVDIAQYLIEFGANVHRRFVHSRNYNGYAPIHLAATLGLLPMIEMLVKYNADINCLTPQNLSPLHLATYKDCTGAILFTLVELGAKRYIDMIGRTPLHTACSVGNANVVVYLVDCGFRVDQTDFLGKTPLNCIGDCIEDRNYNDAYNDFNLKEPRDDSLTDTAYRMQTEAKMVTSLTKYFIMIDTILNAYPNEVPRSYRKYIRNNAIILDDLYEFKFQCIDEIQVTYNTNIGRSRLSYYDILTKKQEDLTANLGEEDLTEVRSLDLIHRRFPIYGSLLHRRFLRIMRRKRLIITCKDLIFSFYKQPSNVSTERLIQHLNSCSISYIESWIRILSDLDAWHMESYVELLRNLSRI